MAESRLRTLSVDFAVQILNLIKFLKGQHETIVSKDKILPGGEYYTADSCVTVLEYTVDYWCGLRIFPITEKFYLTGIE